MSKSEQDELVDRLRSRALAILDAWQAIAGEARAGKGKRAYSKYDKDKSAGAPVLFTPLEMDEKQLAPDERLFAASTSMRDVEPTVHLWVERRQLGGR